MDRRKALIHCLLADLLVAERRLDAAAPAGRKLAQMTASAARERLMAAIDDLPLAPADDAIERDTDELLAGLAAVHQRVRQIRAEAA